MHLVLLVGYGVAELFDSVCVGCWQPGSLAAAASFAGFLMSALHFCAALMALHAWALPYFLGAG